MLKTIYHPLLKCLHTLQSYSNTVLSCMCKKKLHENFRNLTFFVLCIHAYSLHKLLCSLTRCAYVRTPCTTVIIYLICCFACLCLRIYPLHRNLCMWCLCFRGYQLHNEPIDGSSRIAILLWSSPLVTSKVFAPHAMKPLPFL